MFLAKSARKQGKCKYVKYVKCLGPNRAQKGQKFNIFNISPVSSIFCQKHLTFPLFRDPYIHETGEMLNVFGEKCSKQGKCKYAKYVKCLGPNRAQKGQKLNIFNISLVSSIFRQKHLTFPLFRDPTFTKQGKC